VPSRPIHTRRRNPVLVQSAAHGRNRGRPGGTRTGEGSEVVALVADDSCQFGQESSYTTAACRCLNDSTANTEQPAVRPSNMKKSSSLASAWTCRNPHPARHSELNESPTGPLTVIPESSC